MYISHVTQNLAGWSLRQHAELGLDLSSQGSASCFEGLFPALTRRYLHARRFCRLLREGRLDELAVCIIDELHMIRDPARGAALETSVTKLLFSPAGRDVQACPVTFCC